jgi:hypothetical protein
MDLSLRKRDGTECAMELLLLMHSSSMLSVWIAKSVLTVYRCANWLLMEIVVLVTVSLNKPMGS